jgi:hypothetical protein
MSKDYESFEKNDYECESNDDFPSIFTDIFKTINWKVAFFMYLLAIVIFSDVFIDIMLTKDSIYGDCPNTKGTMIQITFLIIGYIIIDLLVQGKCI